MSQDIVRFLNENRWTAGIIGLGYVGLPLAVTASSAGLNVIGLDVDAEKITRLRSGLSDIEDVTDVDLQKAIAEGAEFTTEAAALSDADVILIAVPSPLGRQRQPDTSYIEAATRTVQRVARKGHLISLESTTYPGTTDDIVAPALESIGLVLDEDVHVCYSPERVDPGNMLKTGDIPKVVGGVTDASGRVGAAAYRRLVGSVHLVSSARAAELTKLLENTYRSVNIALINEMAQIAHAFDVDIWEVVDAAATKPFGYQPFYPGPGVGGHCIPLDPQYLAWRARELRVATRFIDLAEDINVHMPEWITKRIIDELNTRGMPVRGTEILLVGMAYKRNVADDRESPSADVMAQLHHCGARLSLFDPHVPEVSLAQHGHEVVNGLNEQRWQMAVILTDHDDVDYRAIAARADIVFDTRGVYRRMGIGTENVLAL